MAGNPRVHLEFGEGCPDCARRVVELPPWLPAVGDDFDWDVRDYDGFRQFMLEALAARFPDRTRWTAADVEVAFVEVLAAQFDKLSDMLDRVAGEFTLETARRPETVRRLLQLIGHDATGLAWRLRLPPFDRLSAAEAVDLPAARRAEAATQLDQHWLNHADAMDVARQAGPRTIRTQHRMVTLEDHRLRLEEHPMVERAHAWQEWGGSWLVVKIAVIPALRRGLDETGPWPPGLALATARFHAERGLPLPDLAAGASLRSVLHPYVEACRMAGQAVEMAAAVEVGVSLALSLQVAANHFQSEVRHAVEQALGTGPGGFFAPGRLRFGEDLWASDIVQALMALDGVANVCINRFKRLGDRFPDMASLGRIALDGLEVAVCDNLPGEQRRGYFRLVLHGGLQG